MSWRREVEALLGPPAGVLAAAITVDAADGRWWLADARRVLFTAGGERDDRILKAMRTAPGVLPLRDSSIAWLAVSFLFDRDRSDDDGGGAIDGGSSRRRALLAEIARVTAAGATVIAVDHNRPRRLAAALVALVAPPRPRGTPAAAWRRLAYPTAREMRAAGFTIERLRFAAGERVQLVVARRAGS
jgi:hypothetical protein